ncbi:MAG: Fic family protein [Phycisphaerae bacterium]|nr:Fic family protein [Tepidisphaeraceae bacterium]
MMTFRQFSQDRSSVPMATTWSLDELSRAVGLQELFTRQSPQKLKVLREHALIESAVSSNRIEGVEVERSRAATLVFGEPVLRDRDEEEVRGYRSALDLIHSQRAALPVNATTILDLHRLARGDIWDAGKLKERTESIIDRYADGRTRIRFMPVEAGAATVAALGELAERWGASQQDKLVHPLIATGAFVLDFLCIHPFRDGNGRASRLLMLLLTYHAGAEVGRYISLERLIEQNKQRYYETLEQSSQGWHEGEHNPWPFLNYTLWILKQAYQEFEQRVGQTAEPLGAKAQLVHDAINKRTGSFSVGELEADCPGVGRDWIRRLLRKMKAAGKLRSFGYGAGARWEKV